MKAVAKTNPLSVGSDWFRKKEGRRWTRIKTNAKNNEVDHVLVDARRILKDVSMLLPLSVQESIQLMLRDKMGAFSVVEKSAINVQIRRKRPAEIDYKKILRQVEAIGWTMTTDTEENLVLKSVHGERIATRVQP